jgi:GxxExxY protein
LNPIEDAEVKEGAEASTVPVRQTIARSTGVRTKQMLIDEVTYKIIGAAMTVHTALGPGLLEKAYDACMADELTNAKLQFIRQVRIPVRYRGVELSSEFKVDYLVAGCVVVELKAVDKLLPLFLDRVFTTPR